MQLLTDIYLNSDIYLSSNELKYLLDQNVSQNLPVDEMITNLSSSNLFDFQDIIIIKPNEYRVKYIVYLYILVQQNQNLIKSLLQLTSTYTSKIPHESSKLNKTITSNIELLKLDQLSDHNQLIENNICV